MKMRLIALIMLSATMAMAQPIHNVTTDAKIAGEMLVKDSVKTLTGYYQWSGSAWAEEIGPTGPTGAAGAAGATGAQGPTGPAGGGGGSGIWASSAVGNAIYDSTSVSIGTDSVYSTLMVNTHAVITAGSPGLVSVPTYTGVGLDDLSITGNWNGVTSGCMIMLGIQDLAPGNGFTYDRFIWGYGGSCGGGSGTPVEITPGSPQALGDGLIITFTNGTGHAAMVQGGNGPTDEYWTASLTAAIPADTSSFPPFTITIDDTLHLMSVDGNGQLHLKNYSFPLENGGAGEILGVVNDTVSWVLPKAYSIGHSVTPVTTSGTGWEILDSVLIGGGTLNTHHILEIEIEATHTTTTDSVMVMFGESVVFRASMNGFYSGHYEVRIVGSAPDMQQGYYLKDIDDQVSTMYETDADSHNIYFMFRSSTAGNQTLRYWNVK